MALSDYIDKIREFFGGKRKSERTSGAPDEFLQDFFKDLLKMLVLDRKFILSGYAGLVGGLSLSDRYIERLKDYDAMDDYDLISAVLDIYADEATFTDIQTKEEIWVECSDSNAEKILNDMLERTVRRNIWDIARSIAKYGNDFNRIVFGDKDIVALDYLSPFNMRVVYLNGKTYYVYLVDPKGSVDEASVAKSLEDKSYVLPDKSGFVFEDWMVVHFRNSSKYRDDPYGYSIIESARWTWKRMVYLENLMFFNRLREAVGRYIHYVNVGDASLNDIPRILKVYANLVKGRVGVSKVGAEYSIHYNYLTGDDDIFVPVRSEKDPTRIEQLPGREVDFTSDIDYYLSKLSGATRVPRDYLTFETNANKMSLGMQDMRFAKAVIRLQKCIIEGVEKLCDIQLILAGYDPTKINYTVRMAQPSAVFELAAYEAEGQLAELISRYMQFLPLEIVLRKYGKFSEEEIKQILKLLKQQKGEEGGYGGRGRF